MKHLTSAVILLCLCQHIFAVELNQTRDLFSWTRALRRGGGRDLGGSIQQSDGEQDRHNTPVQDISTSARSPRTGYGYTRGSQEVVGSRTERRGRKHLVGSSRNKRRNGNTRVNQE